MRTEHHPKSWRETKGLTMEAAAHLVGVTGKGARSTWRNWEVGKCTPPLEVISKVDALSEGLVTFQTWLDIGRDYRRTNEAERVAA